MVDDSGIRKAKDGWTVRVQMMERRTGKIVNRKTTVRGTKQDARRIRDELRSELESIAPKRQRTQLAQYVASWLAQRVGNLAEPTIQKYGASLSHILPALGSLYLDAIAPEDVRAYVTARTASGSAGNTVLNELRLLRTIAHDAHAEGFSPQYWCHRVRPPDVAHYTPDNPNLLTAEQLTQLMATIPAHRRALVALLATTGLRWGEVSGLDWSSVDIKACQIVIRQRNYRGKLGKLKTKGSYRAVPMLPAIAAALGPPKTSGLVFPSVRGKLHVGSPLRAVLDRATKKLGLPHLTTHGLRRSFNNLARQLTSGTILRTITGHATEAMTDHYSMVSGAERLSVSSGVGGQIGLDQSLPSDAPTVTITGDGGDGSGEADASDRVLIVSSSETRNS